MLRHYKVIKILNLCWKWNSHEILLQSGPWAIHGKITSLLHYDIWQKRDDADH